MKILRLVVSGMMISHRIYAMTKYNILLKIGVEKMNNNIKNPFSLVTLFLLPGLFIAIAYALLINPIQTLELPKTVALAVAALVVLVPVELGIILYHSKKQYGIFSIKIILYANLI